MVRSIPAAHRRLLCVLWPIPNSDNDERQTGCETIPHRTNGYYPQTIYHWAVHHYADGYPTQLTSTRVINHVLLCDILCDESLSLSHTHTQAYAHTHTQTNKHARTNHTYATQKIMLRNNKKKCITHFKNYSDYGIDAVSTGPLKYPAGRILFLSLFSTSSDIKGTVPGKAPKCQCSHHTKAANHPPMDLPLCVCACVCVCVCVSFKFTGIKDYAILLNILGRAK